MGGFTASRAAAHIIAAASVFVWCVSASIGGEIMGRVTDDLGGPIGLARVSLWVRTAPTIDRREALTDATGAFQVLDLPARRYHVSITSANHSSEVRNVTVEEDTPARLDVRLTRVAWVSGRITLASGERPYSTSRIRERSPSSPTSGLAPPAARTASSRSRTSRRAGTACPLRREDMRPRVSMR